MKRVVVVHGQGELGATCRSMLESAGYETIACQGPLPPETLCHVLDDGSCPLCESCDLLVYDPWVHESLGPQGSAPIIAALRRRYARKPVIVLGAPADVPLGIAAIAADDPHLRFVPTGDHAGLCQTLHDLAGSLTAYEPPTRWAAARHEQDPGLYGAADCGYCD
jgi:hypothetical protein